MNDSLIENKKTENTYFPRPIFHHQIKPLKKVSLSFPFREIEKPGQERWRILKKYQIKNPKWASLDYEVSYRKPFSFLKNLQKCKSLQLTSFVLKGRQVGATVGHFDGEIKYLQKNSKYLKKLDFSAGAVSKRRFIAVKRWIGKQKDLTDLSFVPYWFPLNRYFEVEDWSDRGSKSAGVVHLIHSLSARIRKLTLFGFVKENVMNRLHFNLLNQLQQFTLKAAFRPESCDGDSEELGDAHLKFIKKAIKSKTLNVLILHCELEFIRYNFLEDLKDIITPIMRPFVVSIQTDLSYSKNLRGWIKNIFGDIPTNLKLNYRNKEYSYLLSLPQGIEVTENQY